MKRRHLLSAAAGAATWIASPAWAQPRSARIVVSFPPGGPVDLVARLLAEQLGTELGHPVIIDNRAGANGAIGANEVMRSPADGNTLWITSVGAAAINPSLYDKLPYQMARDFVPVSLVVNNVELLVVNPSNPAKDAAEFVANSKKSSAPFALASSGIGSIPHFAIEQLIDATQANVLHVPYKGAAPAITDVMGNQVAGFFGDVPGLINYVKSGKLKPLGMASQKRHPALPEVKTLAEQGIRNVDTNNWYALFAAAATPKATVDAMNQAVGRALRNDKLRQRLIDTGAEPAPSTPTELAQLVEQDTAKWRKLIKAKNIRPE